MTNLVGIGMKGQIGYGEESTYGTSATRSYWQEINNESLVLQEARIETNSLTRRGTLNRQVAQGARSVTGNIEFDAQYGGWGKLAKHAFGQIDTTSPDPTNAPTAKLHTFTVADTLPTGLTFEAFRDTSGFTTEPNKAHVYVGCKINTMEFSCAVNEILKINLGIMGQNESREAKGTPNYSTEKLAVYHQGCVTWGSTDRPIESFNIQLNNNLEMRPKLCSNLTREPIQSGKVEITGSFSMEFDTWAEYDDFKAATERQLEVDFTGPLIAATTYKMIKLICPVVILSGVNMNLSSFGRIKVDINFKGYRDSTQNEFKLQIINTETGI